MTLVELLRLLPAGCPKEHAPEIERCSPYLPQLVEISRAVNGPL